MRRGINKSKSLSGVMLHAKVNSDLVTMYRINIHDMCIYFQIQYSVAQGSNSIADYLNNAHYARKSLAAPNNRKNRRVTKIKFRGS